MRHTKIINADRQAWDRIKLKFPGMSDSKRTKLIDALLDETVTFDLMNKLKPEISDTKHDRIMKKIVREIFNR